MSYRLISESTLKAGKRHRCIWCGETIPKGSMYVREASTFDGDFQNHHWHPECRDASVDYFNDGEDEFCPHENERPPSRAVLEWESWDCALLAQRQI